ncbi:MAG TPA: phosphoenolpyruvate--protein phosphotransferase [Pyrinomonadaceae bacterium]|nr:phosphoenolpyruvate--protein phosphotransferase [Pyrinomonadaceae bacterium]
MTFSENTTKNNGAKNKFSEVKLKARAVARGVAIGKVVCLHGRKRQFYRINLDESKIEKEIRRFRAAIRLSKRQLTKISSDNKNSKSNIFEAHLLILEDKSLQEKIEGNIKTQKVNAEWAVKVVTDGYVATYKSIADEHLREKYIDLEDVADRILGALGGGGKSNLRLQKNSIIVAREVKPSTLIELTDSNPMAIITEHGGWTSHTFILAREINLPAVTGMKGILRRVQTGDEVIVDGYNGQIILNPTKESSEKYKIAAAQFQEFTHRETEPVKEKLKTLDGFEVTVRANLDLPLGYSKAKRLGAKGIGLYRSEFLFNQFKGFPSEQEQIKAYQKIAKLAGNEGVRIRTFDLSVEQLTEENAAKEVNPALGLRGIRLVLTHKKEFRTQIRALLQASFENKIDIVLPMISDVSEIRETKKIIESEKDRFRRKKISFGKPRLGAMIEVPSAVLTADEIAREVDFFCLGTNDLVQYLLAVDRDNETVADWFRTLHPAVLRSIKTVLRAAEQNNIPAVICGEMAGSPVYVAILIGLGATELSMNVNSIARVRHTISHIAYEEAKEITDSLTKLSTADAAEDFVRESFLKKWSHLFSPDILPQKKSPKQLKSIK